MDYKTQIDNIRNQFQNSFNFYILRNNYGFSDVAKEYLDEYKSVLTDMWIEDSVKYERLLKIVNRNNEVILSTMKDIPNINKMWYPDYENIKQEQEYYQVDLSDRSKTICDSIQHLFENSGIRSKLSNIDLYNLYVSYYQISNAIKNKTLTNEMLLDIENKVKPISIKIWSDSITPVENFSFGESFMFIVHNFSKTDVTDTTKLNENQARNGRVSASLITDKEMGVYGNHRYGFIYTDVSKIIAAGKKDLYSYETQKEGSYTQDSKHSSLITPQEIEKYCVDKCIEQNGKTLSNDNANIYNEVLLDANGLHPNGVYCITFGEKELSEDYVSAKKLAETVGLPLIEIDISLYRTRNNQGTYLTDREELTTKEQRKFAEDFLKQYYGAKVSDLESRQNFVESDLKIYQDIIVDLFLETKRSGKEIDKDTLFEEFTKLKDKKRDKMQNFNENANESRKLLEAVENLQQALNNADNEEIRTKITNQLDSILQRLNELNMLMENENSIDLSVDNWIYQRNKVSEEIMQKFTPFTTEKVQIGDKTIEVITGYKTKEQIEQEKQHMLEQVSLSSDTTLERLEHAKRVIEVKCNGFITNSTVSQVNQYDIQSPELESIVDSSKLFIEVSSLDKEINNYDKLMIMREQLISHIQNLENNRKILNGSSQINWIEQLQKEGNDEVNSLNTTIKNLEEQLRELRSNQTQLKYDKEQLEKFFFNKLISSTKIQNLEHQINDINMKIEQLERSIERSKFEIKSKEEFVNGQVDNFLKNFGLDGMTLEEYKTMLATIEPNGYELTDLSKQKGLEDKISEIEKIINEMKINATNEQQKREQLQTQKQQLGFSSTKDILPEQVITSDEEVVEELSSGIKR